MSVTKESTRPDPFRHLVLCVCGHTRHAHCNDGICTSATGCRCETFVAKVESKAQ